jgi:protein involved in polysaccharide export with SLBB domain
MQYLNLSKAAVLSFFCTILAVAAPHISAFAQSKATLNLQTLQNVKVDELTDDQVISFWKQARERGITKPQLEAMAIQRNMPPAELEKLMLRIDKLEGKMLGEVKKPKMNEKPDDKLGKPKEEELSEEEEKEIALNELFGNLELKVFGMDIFSNKNLTFEPSTNTATPANYVIGVGDELTVDIFGYSEASYEIKVTGDGFIRIPGAGLVKVAGATIEQARVRVTNQLRNVYSTIATGQTKVNVSVSGIRSIKVTVMGEVNTPGTYTLSSLSTVFNALHASGGPTENGSLRSISVIRSGKTIIQADVYDFLIKGNATTNIVLQDQDIIKVNPYVARVSITGEVKRPAYYEIRNKETLKDLVDFAGGFTPKAYTAKVKLTRNTQNQRAVADVNEDLISMFEVKSGDEYHVGAIIDRFENRVSIEGAVFRPGNFSLEKGMTLKTLVAKADGITEDAFVTRAIIYRLKDDNSLEMVSVNLGALLEGKTADIPLKREDKVIVASKLDMKEELQVKIQGEVLMPGEYDFAENMTVQDLIIAAGGFKESASIKNIQIGRRAYDADRKSAVTEIAKVFTIDVDQELKDVEGVSSFVLMPFDIVTIFPNPGYIAQTSVNVSGQVMYPGVFVISKNKERLSDVINRAGGLTNEGFADGAVLIRYRQNTIAQQMINYNKNRALKKLLKEDDEEIMKQKSKDEDFVRTFDMVSIDLKQALAKPGSKFDIFLSDRDQIFVPKVQQSVLVSGEVLFPVKIVFEKGLSFNDYVRRSGGYSTEALKRKAYVVYPNGSAKATRNYVLFKVRPKIKPGSEIIVPQKERREKLSTPETISIITSTTTLLIILTNIVLSRP